MGGATMHITHTVGGATIHRLMGGATIHNIHTVGGATMQGVTCQSGLSNSQIQQNRLQELIHMEHPGSVTHCR